MDAVKKQKEDLQTEYELANKLYENSQVEKSQIQAEAAKLTQDKEQLSALVKTMKGNLKSLRKLVAKKHQLETESSEEDLSQTFVFNKDKISDHYKSVEREKELIQQQFVKDNQEKEELRKKIDQCEAEN